MVSPRISEESIEKAQEVVQPDDPTNIPDPDLDDDQDEDDPDDDIDDDLDDEDEDEDADTDVGPDDEGAGSHHPTPAAITREDPFVPEQVKALPEPGEPLTAGHYAGFDVADIEPALADDPETSMVESVFLHLLSEHDRYDALHLEEQDAFTMHARLHQDADEDGLDLDHSATDLRFRPAKALGKAMRYVQTVHETAQEIVPA